MKKIKPIHPGVILKEEFLKPFNISQNALAKALKVAPRRVNEIVNQKRGITADTALRLSRYFGTTAEFWLNLQSKYELESTKEKIAKKIDKEVEVYVV
jgi:addiction module HigA family antidote